MKSLKESTFVVRPSESDINRRMTPSGVLERMEEIAWFHAEELGYGVEALRNQGVFWVVTRMAVEFDRLPVSGDEITLQTWPKGRSGFYAFRDWLWIDAKGKEIGRATSTYVMLDMKTRKVAPLNDLPESLLERAHIHAIEHVPEKIPAVENVHRERSFEIPFSDIDLNNHVNNTKYLRWLIDTFSGREWTKPWSSLTVNFLAEAKESEKIVSRRQANGLDHIMEALSSEINKVVFRAHIRFN